MSPIKQETRNQKPETSLICLVGPTASGKTSLAIELANKFNGEIVSADSRQIYHELELGTAKPSNEDRQKNPHHLIDCASINSPWSAARYAEEAQRIIANIVARQHLPIVVGGTGLYIKSLLFGLDEIEHVSGEVNAALADELKTKGLEFLYEELKRVDPASAERIKPGDTQRILRALGVFRQTGRGIHEHWKGEKNQARYPYLKLALDIDRKELYRRIDERVVEMLRRGLKEEAAALIKKYPNNTVLTKTIGYAEWVELGFDDDEQVLAEIQKNTRNFAKRQLTWLRGEKDVRWVRGEIEAYDQVMGFMSS